MQKQEVDAKEDAMRAALGFPSMREEKMIMTELRWATPAACLTERQKAAAFARWSELHEAAAFDYHERIRVLISLENKMLALGVLEGKPVTVNDLAAWVATLGRSAALWEKFGVEDVVPAPRQDEPIKHRAPRRGPVLVPARLDV